MIKEKGEGNIIKRVLKHLGDTPAKGKEDSEMMTIAEVARLLNVSLETVRKWSNKGLFHAYRIGTRGDRRFNRKDIERFIKHE